MTTTATIYNAPRIGSLCKWGKVDNHQSIAEGIDWVSTASHGGYIVSPARLEQMPKNLRACSFTQDNHFEEDCSWVGVILAFPHLFPLPAVEQAWTVYGRIYATR